jgi:hypothetical protein
MAPAAKRDLVEAPNDAAEFDAGYLREPDRWKGGFVAWELALSAGNEPSYRWKTTILPRRVKRPRARMAPAAQLPLESMVTGRISSCRPRRLGRE